MHSRHANELVINLLDVISDLREHTQADSFLARTNEFNDIGQHIISPERAIMFISFPFLEKLPLWCLSGAFALMERCRELSQQLLNEPFNEVKAYMANGTASRSLVADFLSQVDDNADEDTMKAVALMGYVGKGFFIRTEFIAN
ncbi:hypothetical protein DFH29DRAFT_927947 [Suillus ampliporus]|nr:hypothetical protein DFH29DRAFT_927947 [Suillus ampliporus]